MAKQKLTDEQKAKLKTIGGESDTFGNDYRYSIAAQLGYQLLFLQENAYLEIEKDGDDIRFFDGNCLNYIESKKNAPGNANSWTVSNLDKAGINEFFTINYLKHKENIGSSLPKDYRVVLISSDHSHRLDILSFKGIGGRIREEEFNAIRKEFKIPETVIDLNDYFSHLRIASVSRFAIEFLLGPLNHKLIEKRVIDQIRGFIFSEGFIEGRVTKQLLTERISDVKLWVGQNSPVLEQELTLNKVNFIRQPANINEVKRQLQELEKLYVSNHSEFNKKVTVGLNYYNSNIKYVLGILDIYKTRSFITNEDAEFLATNIKGNPLYLWHFLKGLVGNKWLAFYNKNLFVDLCNGSDSGLKGLVVEYIKTTIGDFPSESLDCLYNTAKNEIDDRVCRSICEALSKLEIDDDRIWKTLKIIVGNDNSWVREEVAGTIEVLCKLNYPKSLSILKKLLVKEVDPKDVVTGGPVLSLKFQGRDLENHAFNQSMTTLGKLLNEYPEKSYKFATDLLFSYLRKENRIKYRNSKTILEDLSHFWYSQSNPEKREHEYDKKERLSMEIEASFQHLVGSDYREVENIARIILKNNCEISYLIVLNVLVKSAGLNELKKELVFNSELWRVHGIREGYLQSLIKNYFKDNPALVDKFSSKVLIETFDPRIKQLIIKDLLSPLDSSKNVFPKSVGVIITEVEGKSGPDLNIYNVDEIVKIVLKDGTAKEQVDSWKLRGSLNSLGEKMPNIGFKLLNILIKLDQVDTEIIGELIDGLIISSGKDIKKINSLVGLLRKKDDWSKLSLVRYFHQRCRSANKISSENRKLIIASLENLSYDTDPEDNDVSLESSNALGLVTDGINSIRGLVAETVCYYLSYFPNNKIAQAIFIRLSADSSHTVKAIILYNLKYIIKHPLLYKIAKVILEQYKNIRIAGTDVAIIEFVSNLGNIKFEENKKWLSIISKNSTNGDVLGRLGEVMVCRYLGGYPIKEYIDQQIIKKEGDARVRHGMAYQLELNYPQAIEGKLAVPKVDVLVYLKHLINPAIEHDQEVRNRAAFVFNREDIPYSELVNFIDNDFFILIGNDVLNAHSQESAVKFLVRCSGNDIANTVKAITQMINKDSMILNDSLGARDIMIIIKDGFNNSDKLTHELAIKLENILDLMIEKGWDEAITYFKTIINSK